MKKSSGRKKKNKGAHGVKVPGGGTLIYAHVTRRNKSGRLVSTPLSRAQAKKLAQGPIAAAQSLLKQELAKTEVLVEGTP